jgi:hypothetical protein
MDGESYGRKADKTENHKTTKPQTGQPGAVPSFRGNGAWVVSQQSLGDALGRAILVGMKLFAFVSDRGGGVLCRHGRLACQFLHLGLGIIGKTRAEAFVRSARFTAWSSRRALSIDRTPVTRRHRAAELLQQEGAEARIGLAKYEWTRSDRGYPFAHRTRTAAKRPGASFV